MGFRAKVEKQEDNSNMTNCWSCKNCNQHLGCRNYIKFCIIFWQDFSTLSWKPCCSLGSFLWLSVKLMCDLGPNVLTLAKRGLWVKLFPLAPISHLFFCWFMKHRNTVDCCCWSCLSSTGVDGVVMSLIPRAKVMFGGCCWALLAGAIVTCLLPRGHRCLG